MLSRRQMLRNSALSLAALTFSPRQLLGQMNMEPSASSPWLDLFADPLRIPPVLTPVMRGKTQFYTTTMRAGLAKVHRDLPRTVVWGFDGLFPGPTIKATKGQPVMIRHVTLGSAGSGECPCRDFVGFAVSTPPGVALLRGALPQQGKAALRAGMTSAVARR